MVAIKRPLRRVINSSSAYHDKFLRYWENEEVKHMEATRTVPTRFERMEKSLQTSSVRKGDELVAKVKDVFHNGLGIKWGDDQIRVFQAFLASCLPLIYGNSWPDEKARVLKEWGLKRECMFSLVNMARRNGKTFVTSGTSAALFLVVPEIKLAIFSTCKRTSQMMMSAIMDMLDKAFELGTHVNREDYVLVTKNLEAVCYEGPDGTKRHLGSFPGSVRVSIFSFHHICPHRCTPFLFVPSCGSFHNGTIG